MSELRILRTQIREVAPGEWAADPHKRYVTRTVDTLQFLAADGWKSVPIVDGQDREGNSFLGYPREPD